MIAQQTSDDTVQGAFRALADPTRREILMLLSEDDMTIGEVAERFEITRAAVKKHLIILQEGRLISVQPRGRQRVNRLEPMALKRVSDWLTCFDRFWDERLSALQKAVEHDNRGDADLHPGKSSKGNTGT